VLFDKRKKLISIRRCNILIARVDLQLIPEGDFTNNTVVVGLHIEGDTVTVIG